MRRLRQRSFGSLAVSGVLGLVILITSAACDATQAAEESSVQRYRDACNEFQPPKSLSELKGSPFVALIAPFTDADSVGLGRSLATGVCLAFAGQDRLAGHGATPPLRLFVFDDGADCARRPKSAYCEAAQEWSKDRAGVDPQLMLSQYLTAQVVEQGARAIIGSVDSLRTQAILRILKDGGKDAIPVINASSTRTDLGTYKNFFRLSLPDSTVARDAVRFLK
jgi:hypothetical protein